MYGTHRIDRVFTLLEVLVAVAILGMSLALILQILGASRERVLRAERRWSRRHVLEQAAEFHLLAGPNARIPAGFLPEGFESRASLAVDPSNLPVHAAEPKNGWMPATLTVTVADENGEVVAEQDIEQIVPETVFAR